MTVVSDLKDSGVDPALWERLLGGGTLPGYWYTDSDIFEVEKRKIFGRLWQYAGRSDHVAEPGQYFIHRAGDVPIIVVRDKSGELHALVNMCRHRAAEVVLDESGSRSSFQCKYHGWTYALNGQLRGAPRTKDDASFSLADWPLYKASVATWGPFIFVHPDADAPPLQSQLGVIPKLIEEQSGIDMGALQHVGQRDYDIAANWKVLVENFNECYHCPILHPEWTEGVYVDDFKLYTHNFTFVQDVSGKDDDSKAPPAGRVNWVTKGTYTYVFPNFMCNSFPGPTNIFMRKLIPLDADHTHVQYEQFCTPDVSPLEAEEVTHTPLQIFEQDIPICEAVQRGLRTGRFETGRLLLPYHENGPHHFMKLVYLAMADELLENPSRANGVPDRTLPTI